MNIYHHLVFTNHRYYCLIQVPACDVYNYLFIIPGVDEKSRVCCVAQQLCVLNAIRWLHSNNPTVYFKIGDFSNYSFNKLHKQLELSTVCHTFLGILLNKFFLLSFLYIKIICVIIFDFHYCYSISS